MIVHIGHQEIEPYLIEEIENKVLMKGKKKMKMFFFSSSPSLAPCYDELKYIHHLLINPASLISD